MAKERLNSPSRKAGAWAIIQCVEAAATQPFDEGQATERRLGEDGIFAKKRPTLMFNGYESQVGQMYAGLDLAKNY